MINKYPTLALLLLFLAISIQGVQAQKNFRPGYIVRLAGDTLRGEVDSREGNVSAERCQFRPSAQAASTTYQPADLRGYGLLAEKRHYRSLSTTVAPAAPQLRFLELLVDGPAMLYFLRDAEQREAFYVASPTLPLTRLEHAVVRVVRDGSVYTEEQNSFRNTLATALAGCASAQSLLPRLVFQESALRKAVAAYNTCQAPNAAKVDFQAPARRAVFGITGGPVLHSLSYSGYPFDENVKLSSNHFGFAIGPVVRLRPGQLHPKTYICACLALGAREVRLGGC